MRRLAWVTALLLVAAWLLTPAVTAPVHAAEPTTSVHVVRYASDGTTVLAETTLDYQWMEASLPVCGDGVTHYYHQGPVFEGDKWDPDETTNLKDKGAVRGTDVRDLCEQVGGMSPGDEVMVCSVDGYQVTFGYATIYEPTDRQGPLVVCWYNGEDAGSGEHQGDGYPPSFVVAMRLVFMAGTANAEGKFVFGNWDMHECLPEEAQHFYGDLYPSTNGLSGKWVNEVRVYSGEAPPDSAPDVTPAPTPTPTPQGPSNGDATAGSSNTLWLVVIGAAAVVLVAVLLTLLVRRRR